jgi:hypothetical protein
LSRRDERRGHRRSRKLGLSLKHELGRDRGRTAEQELGRVRASLTTALADVGFPAASAAGPGTRELRLWNSTQGPTVIELVDWDEDDPKRVAALSRTLGADVAVSFHNGAGEVETYAFFVGGKKSKVPATPIGRLASEHALDLTPASNEESLLVRGAATEACTRKTIGELLDGLCSSRSWRRRSARSSQCPAERGRPELPIQPWRLCPNVHLSTCAGARGDVLGRQGPNPQSGRASASHCDRVPRGDCLRRVAVRVLRGRLENVPARCTARTYGWTKLSRALYGPRKSRFRFAF